MRTPLDVRVQLPPTASKELSRALVEEEGDFIQLD